MTQQFHEGQDVEVNTYWARDSKWNRAKIVRMAPDGGAIFNPVYETTLGAFDAEHIRSVDLDVPEIIMVPR